MNKKHLFTVLAILYCTFISISLVGQENEESISFETQPINITFVDASKYQDVNFIISNLKRSPHIVEISLSKSSRDLIEYTGKYKGSPDTIIEEISSLAQERFSVEIEKSRRLSKKDGLRLTLKKIRLNS